jgi:hypothetical protein
MLRSVEELLDHARRAAETLGHVVDVLEAVAVVGGDAEVIGAEEVEGSDAVALRQLGHIHIVVATPRPW